MRPGRPTMMANERGNGSGPLTALRVVELAGMGPGPHAAMQLADLGADVVRIERPGTQLTGDLPLAGRSRVQLDLTTGLGLDEALSLIDVADVLIEGFRPGVVERLGLGPDICVRRNPRLVYGRMTGWGQTGPLASTAGHDINYLATTGVLHAIGRRGQRPVPPLNVVADFGGGSMLLLVGLLSALLEREVTDAGQVVDAAMVDGVGLLAQMFWSFRNSGRWSDERGSNLIDGGAPFYDTYECADGAFVAVGAIEPKFYANLIRGLGLDESTLPAQMDKAKWPQLRRIFAGAFANRSRDEWTSVFGDADACVSPVLSFAEAPAQPHALARNAFIVTETATSPAPAPRFSRTPLERSIARFDEPVPVTTVQERWSASAAGTPHTSPAASR